MTSRLPRVRPLRTPTPSTRSRVPARTCGTSPTTFGRRGPHKQGRERGAPRASLVSLLLRHRHERPRQLCMALRYLSTRKGVPRKAFGGTPVVNPGGSWTASPKSHPHVAACCPRFPRGNRGSSAATRLVLTPSGSCQHTSNRLNEATISEWYRRYGQLSSQEPSSLESESKKFLNEAGGFS